MRCLGQYKPSMVQNDGSKPVRIPQVMLPCYQAMPTCHTNNSLCSGCGLRRTLNAQVFTRVSRLQPKRRQITVSATRVVLEAVADC